MPVVASQLWPAPQHALHPQRVWPAPHSGTHTPPEQVSPQPQGGVHVSGTHVPDWQNSPPGQAPRMQVPPQPFGPPQAAEAGQLGVHTHA